MLSPILIIAALWLIASILAALLLGPFCGFNDREPLDDVPDGRANRDRFAGPGSFPHDGGVGE